MANFASLAATAERLIAKNGRDVIFRLRSSTPADAQKPWRGTASSNTRTTGKAVLLDYSETDVDGELVKRGDKKVLVAAAIGVDLRWYDALIDETREYRIVDVEEIKPGPVRVLWKLQVRS